MSFTTDVKNELCQIEYETKCCMRAHLAGIAGFCGAVVHENGEELFRMRTENVAIARRAYTLIKKIFGTKAVLSTTGKICVITVEQNAKMFLAELGYCRQGIVKFSLDPFVVHDECCRQAFLAGAFLGGGYVKTPKNGYHFEIKNHYRTIVYDLGDMIEEMGFEPKVVMRKSEYVVYLKQSDAIGDLLKIMGATDAMFEIFNVKILKDVRNNITRKINCDTANISKTADAAAMQLHAIHIVKTKLGLESLPKALEQAARLRLENPEANLTELGQMLVPPISKSGVNHRLKKIMELAKELSES